ncbi:MAG: hypothetical protein AAF690_17395 [Acidobacteriota bacterium]
MSEGTSEPAAESLSGSEELDRLLRESRAEGAWWRVFLNWTQLSLVVWGLGWQRTDSAWWFVAPVVGVLIDGLLARRRRR